VLQAEGKAQKHIGDAEQAAEDVRHSLNEATKRHI
jgi:uncharacterized protein YjbJ (UPF0337 family)